MNFADARQAHASWKLRLRAVLRGTSNEKLSPADVAADNRCQLGKWLQEPAQRRHELDELRALHQRFHLAAADVLNKATSGDRAAAEAELATAGSLGQLSIQLNRLLTILEPH